MRKTAEEFLAELESDPTWVAAREQRERDHRLREAELARAEADLVAELRAVGLDIDSVWDLVNNAPHPILVRRFIGPYPEGYPVLLRHLPRPCPRPIREGIIRALTVRDGGRPVEAALLGEFERELDPHLRWVLANALRTAMPYSRRRRRPEIAAALKGENVRKPDGAV